MRRWASAATASHHLQIKVELPTRDAICYRSLLSFHE